MASKFTPEVRGVLIERYAAGCSNADAARAAGLHEMTVKRWLTRGKREEKGEYADFYAAVQAARKEARSRPEPGDGDDLKREVWAAVTRGSTQAMKLYWEILCAESAPDEPEEPADPLAELDELAERRSARAA